MAQVFNFVLLLMVIFVLPQFTWGNNDILSVAGVQISEKKLEEWRIRLSAENGLHVENCSLEDAFCIAMVSHPEIKVRSFDVLIANQNIKQVRVLENPHLSVEYENINGSESAEIDDPEMKYSLSVNLPSVLKRSSKRKSLSREKKLIELKNAIQAIHLLSGIHEMFREIARLNVKIEILNTMYTLNKEIHTISLEKLLLGKSSPLDTLNSYIQLTKSKIQLEHIKNTSLSMLYELPFVIGNTRITIDTIAYAGEMKRILDSDSLVTLFESNSLVLQTFDLTEKLKKLEMKQVKGKIIPEIELDFTVKKEIGSNNKLAYSSGVAFPIPLFNVNRNEIKNNRFNQQKLSLKKSAYLLQGKQTILHLSNKLKFLYMEIEEIERSIMPSLTIMQQSAKIAYTDGKFSILEINETQKEYYDQLMYLNEKKAEYRNTFSELEFFINHSAGTQ